MSITPDGPASDHDRENDGGSEPNVAGPSRSNRTDMPGIFLMVVGILSLLGAGLQLVRGVQFKELPAEILQEPIDKMQKDAPEIVDKYNVTPERFKSFLVTISFSMGGVGMVASLLVILGGIRMRALRSYGLAMTGAVLSIVPCVTCAGCCGLGQGVGLWALIVLLKPEVKALFR